jgi:hypothetical protein
MRATDILARCFTKDLHSIHKSRLKSVFFGVDALLRGGRLSLTELGRAARSGTAPKHSIKRVDRLLGNGRLVNELPIFCRAITRYLVGGDLRPTILVDWTRIGNTHYALVASMPRDGRAMPLYYEIHPAHYVSKPDVERQFLEGLSRILPWTCRPTLVTDAGYQNPWFRQVQALGWDYVGRLATHVYVRPIHQDEWSRNDALERSALRGCTDLGPCEITKSGPLVQRVIIAAKFKRNPIRSPMRKRPSGRGLAHSRAVKRNQVPWVLATTRGDLSPKQVIALYARRMQIEETFRDTKNIRFGWSFRHAFTRSANRYAILLLLAALAGFVLTIIGIAAEKRDLHLLYQANTIRHRRVLSLFYLGKAILARARPPELAFLDIKDACKCIKGPVIV